MAHKVIPNAMVFFGGRGRAEAPSSKVTPAQSAGIASFDWPRQLIEPYNPHHMNLR